MKRSALKLIPAAILLYTFGSNIAFAQDQAAALANATNQAAIAAQNLATATSNANAALAQATAAQTLQSNQINNEKNQIANIQAALTAPSVASLKASGTLTVPTLNASYNNLLSDELATWLKHVDPTAFTSLAKCDNVFISRTSLPQLILVYAATDSKLFADWSNLNAVYTALNLMKVVDETPAKPAKGKKPVKPAQGAELVNQGGPPTTPANGGLLGVAAVDALANFALNAIAAAKEQTALGTATINPAGKIVEASISQYLLTEKKIGGAYFDSDLAIAAYLNTAKTGTCLQSSVDTVQTLPILAKANCLAEMLAAAQTLSDAKAASLKPLDPAAKTDPNAAMRSKIAAINSLIAQGTADMQAIYTPDKATGLIPYVSALQGAALNKTLGTDKSCVLTVTTISSDVDSVVRDGTFTSYKLSLAAATTISWRVSTTAGQILEAGFHSLASPWARQPLDNK